MSIASIVAQCACLTPVHTPIIMGQSNENATGGIPAAAPTTIGDAYIWSVDGANEVVIPGAANDPLVLGVNSGSGNLPMNFSPGTVWVDSYSSTQNIDVYAFKLARGSTHIGQWNTQTQLLGTFTDQWALFVADLSAQCLRPVVPKIIWNQGESDASRENTNYYADLQTFYDNINGVIGQTPPWEIVPLSDQYFINNPTHEQQVQVDQLQFCSDNPMVNCVDVSGLTYQDALHYDAASVIELGGRLCNVNYQL